MKKKNLLLIISICDTVLDRNALHSIKHACISKQETCIVWELPASSFAEAHIRVLIRVFLLTMATQKDFFSLVRQPI